MKISVEQNPIAESSGRTIDVPCDIGPEFLVKIFEGMKIDPEWSVQTGRSLTWWAHRLAQRIWAEPVHEDNGHHIIRVHAHTDLLRDVPDCAETDKLLSAFNSLGGVSGFVFDRDTGRVGLRCSAYLHVQNFDWLFPFFFCATAIQAAEANSHADEIAELLNGNLDVSSHPLSGARSTPDDMLNVIEGFFAPRGEEASAFTSKDFQVAMNLNPRPWVMANASEDGFTAEFSFPGCMPPTALLTINNKATHPRLGSGLSLRLRLPVTLSGVDVAGLASKMNLAELNSEVYTHFMGAWCLDFEGNMDLAKKALMLGDTSKSTSTMKELAKKTLTYCSFIPSAAYNASILPNLVYAMAQRSGWANKYLASLEGISDFFGPRDNHALEDQTEEYFSLGKNILRKAKQALRKKPN